MFTSQKSTGSGHTTTVAYLAGAIFVPLIVLLTRPVSYTAVSLAIVATVLCVALAWVNWKRASGLPGGSTKAQRGIAK